MARSERLLALLQTLRNRRRPVTAADLGSELGVSERSVYRDLASLRGQGAGIEGSPGLGYILRADHFLPPLMLTGAEADSVVLGLRFVLQRGDPELVAAARSAAAKVASVLPAALEEKARLNGLAAAPAGNACPKLGRVRQALQSDRKLQICYRDADDRSTRRIIWPVVVGFFDGAEVVAGWCELRGGFRHFRLDRITEAEVKDDRLPKPRRVLLAEWQKQNAEVVF